MGINPFRRGGSALRGHHGTTDAMSTISEQSADPAFLAQEVAEDHAAVISVEQL